MARVSAVVITTSPPGRESRPHGVEHPAVAITAKAMVRSRVRSMAPPCDPPICVRPPSPSYTAAPCYHTPAALTAPSGRKKNGPGSFDPGRRRRIAPTATVRAPALPAPNLRRGPARPALLRPRWGVSGGAAALPRLLEISVRHVRRTAARRRRLGQVGDQRLGVSAAGPPPTPRSAGRHARPWSGR
jgi:hypothetical protein